MYALVSVGIPPFLRARRGKYILPRGTRNALVFLWAPFFLRGWHGTRYPGKGSETRPDVAWGTVAFACQAWHNVHCQGIFMHALMYTLVSLAAPPFLRNRRGTM